MPNSIIELETNSYSFFLLPVTQPGTCAVIPLDVGDVEDVQGQRVLSLIFTPECCKDKVSKKLFMGEKMPYSLKPESLTGQVSLREVI